MSDHSTPRTIDRPARARQELASVPEGDACARKQHLQEIGHTFSAEALVFLARQACASGDRAMMEICGRLLCGVPLGNGRFAAGHCEPMITSHARHFGVGDDQDARNEFRARCHTALWQAITAGSEAKPFFEERFYSALKALVIDIGRSMIRERKRHRLDHPVTEDGSASDVGASVDSELEAVSGIVTDEIKQAIRKLPDRLRDAAWLAWVQDWRVESKDPNDQRTVAAALNITGRMVRKRLTAATQLLRDDPTVTRIMDDHGWS